MPIFEYKALDRRGKKVSGILDAESQRAARVKLRSDGFYPVEIQAGARAEATRKLSGNVSSFQLFRRVSPQERAVMTRQLGTLLGAGIPLVSSLETIIRQTKNRAMLKALVDIRETVLEGTTLAEAMSRHRWLFSDLYVNMVHAGETSGALEPVLQRIADLLERNVRMKNRVQSALFYPITMLCIGAVIVIFLLTNVVPIVTTLFADAEQQLPLPTIILITASNFITNYWWAALAGVALIVFIIRRILKTPAGRLTWDRVKLRLPVIGGLYRKLVIARFSRTLGTLLEGGLTLTAALGIVQHVISNAFMARHVETAIQAVNEGKELTIPLENSRAFPPMVIQMVSAGERSGAMEEMLLKIADAYEGEVDTTVNALTSLLEPFLILVMGVCVGFMVVSILLPILEMSRLLG